MMNQMQRSVVASRNPATVRSMFDSIAPTYDFLNHLLSFGLDIRWRKKATALLAKKRDGIFLDIAAGSGDVSLDLLALQPLRIVATDFAFNMLTTFRQKLNARAPRSTINLVSCDALALPFDDNVFDGTIVAFGIRNFTDRLRSLQEMQRVLKPDGISIILELTHPRQPVVKQLYRLYSRACLPLVGKIISRHNDAYRYLPDSIADFPDREEFLGLMAEAGFAEILTQSLTFGAATIYVAKK